MENPTGGPCSARWQPQSSAAAGEETEVTSRYATETELEALGYEGRVIVMQILRTTFRADGTPIGKTLTVQGGSTPFVQHLDPEGLEDEEAPPVGGERPGP
jgi:hypothetical protein